jgi:RNA methyltransferase, TrmH family
MIVITSKTNPKIKDIRALRQHKARQESGLFLVEGIHPVGEAVQAGANLDCLCYAPDILASEFAYQLVATQAAAGVPCLAVSAEVFATLADKEHPQGILAVIRQPNNSLDQLTPQNFPWGVALASPQDPGNIGTVMRTIDAIGASGLLLLDGGAEPYHPNAVRASMGTIFWYPMVSASFTDFVAWARRYGYMIYGTSSHANTDYQSLPQFTQPALLLLGSEQKGLSPQQLQVCDCTLSLPMRGHVSSLNLAVAAGVMLYTMQSRFGLPRV